MGWSNSLTWWDPGSNKRLQLGIERNYLPDFWAYYYWRNACHHISWLLSSLFFSLHFPLLCICILYFVLVFVFVIVATMVMMAAGQQTVTVSAGYPAPHRQRASEPQSLARPSVKKKDSARMSSIFPSEPLYNQRNKIVHHYPYSKAQGVYRIETTTKRSPWLE